MKIKIKIEYNGVIYAREYEDPLFGQIVDSVKKEYFVNLFDKFCAEFILKIFKN